MDLKIEGLSYTENVIDEKTEQTLIDFIEGRPWSHALTRATQHYGYVYDYSGSSVNQTTPIPDILNELADSIGVNRADRKIDQVIVNKYEPGQGIGAHIDNKLFDGEIACLSLKSAIKFYFEKNDDYKDLSLKRRSLVIMREAARNEWMHGIVPRKSDIVDGRRVKRGTRISITFRKVI